MDDVSVYTAKLIEGFRELGQDCHLYGPFSSSTTKPRKIMTVAGPGTLRVWSQNLFPIQILRRALKDRPDILHIQFEFYGIHSYGPLYTSLGLMGLLTLLKLLGVKTAITLHLVISRGRDLRMVRDTSPSSERLPTWFLTFFLVFFYRLVSILSNGLVVHSEAFKRRMVLDYGVDPSKVAVIPHGVDHFDLSVHEMERRLKDNRSILYFGVLSPRKGLESLLSAFSLLLKHEPNSELILAGGTPPYYHGYEEKLKNQASDLGLGGHVHFLGTVDEQEAHDLLSRAAYVVLPYYYSMSASGALSWALGHGVAVIATETDYFKEEMSKGQFGLLVPPGNSEKLAEAMRKLLIGHDLRDLLSRNARGLSESRSWGNVANMTLAFYRELTKQR